jgi:3-dehydroquinate synthase
VSGVLEFPVTPGGGGYPVRIGRGSLAELPGLLGQYAPAARYAIISDSTVADLHGLGVLGGLRSSGLSAELLRFPAGEAHKTRESWIDLTDRMLAAGFGRDSVVVALGGGVTGDLGGFVAATYMRGIPVVQVPTSMLAMIDASVGGKTGVDVPGGKNLVGAFHPPRLVLVDADVVRTLPRAERARGLAEAVKHGAIRDRSHLEAVGHHAEALLEGQPTAVEAVVAASVEVKARVVSEDELEGGVRRILNFGHTLAHALESVTGFSLSHGEAVAAGMVLEARLGEKLGVTQEGTSAGLSAVLARLELPVRPPAGLDPAAVVAATRTDKKNAAGIVRYALLERLGRADEAGGEWVRPVPDGLVLEVLGAG